MRPGGFRNDGRFAAAAGSCLVLANTAPALATSFNSPAVVGSAPLSIALGAAAFAVLAMLAVRKLGRDGKAAARAAGEQIAGLRIRFKMTRVGAATSVPAKLRIGCRSDGTESWSELAAAADGSSQSRDLWIHKPSQSFEIIPQTDGRCEFVLQELLQIR